MRTGSTHRLRDSSQGASWKQRTENIHPFCKVPNQYKTVSCKSRWLTSTYYVKDTLSCFNSRQDTRTHLFLHYMDHLPHSFQNLFLALFTYQFTRNSLRKTKMKIFLQNKCLKGVSWCEMFFFLVFLVSLCLHE